ncbi:ParB/RepB/Spo0J family partition protein [Variovorax ginsengisoli]|uniref:ParB family chromosome partitioning protein n=1 Tax=Variovorax ginsengisoli TaxID=363844 RepID=A0ABT9SDE7_9BURK|nr:ParB/RepB/Spo0J family partition protein [Variovorax ginsengisoli]MDP9902378.1 ParB family chromosome partitioning protein [Variovorax ginsengisoli]
MAKVLSVRERASLAAKSFSVAPPEPQAPALRPPSGVRSGPAHAIQAMHADAETARENEQLREELKVWENATPARKLDPKRVKPSRWANRHDDSFTTPEFETLKNDIARAGANVQPIKVRPVGESGEEFEIVYGHRRHRACLELGLQVFALVETLSEEQLFVEMDRENRERADLRPYEQGEMYRRALDDGLYPSLRRLADALGVAHSNVSRALAIARLPREILDAFPSPLEIQYRWSEPLGDALKRDSAAVLALAASLRDERSAGSSLSAKAVYDRLIDARSSTSRRQVMAGDVKAFTVKESKNGVAIELKAVSPAKLKAIEEFIVKTLAG